MNQSKGTKINQLLQHWPKGTVATSSWLEANGIRFDLAERYRRSGWLTSVGRGACIRTGDNVGWKGACYALQKHLGLPAHPGGKSALRLLGKSHYITTSGQDKINLFCQRGERLPVWFTSYDWGADIDVIATNLFATNSHFALSNVSCGEFTIKVSSAERAIMEMLYCVPASETAEEVKIIFEGLMTLRPEIVSRLLEDCSSVKVKRLFMVLAEMFNHPWLSKVAISKVDFGKGKRSLFNGGIFNDRYHITVPDDWRVAAEEKRL